MDKLQGGRCTAARSSEAEGRKRLSSEDNRTTGGKQSQIIHNASQRAAQLLDQENCRYSWSATKETRQLLTGLKEVKDPVSAAGSSGEGGAAIFNQPL